VTSQGENSAIFGKTFMRDEQEEHIVSVPEGVSWQPIPGQDIATTPIMTPMAMDRGPFGIHSLASLGIQFASIGGPPSLPRWDGLHNSIAIHHSADAVMETAGIPEWRDG
jgi:hypothetical protein